MFAPAGYWLTPKSYPCLVTTEIAADECPKTCVLEVRDVRAMAVALMLNPERIGNR